METVITRKCCTALRATECDLLSDGGELELIDNRCRRVSDILYTCACGCCIHSGMSRASFSHMSQPSSQTRFFNIWRSCDVLSSASAWNQVSFFKNSDLVFTLSLLHQLFRDCLHTSLSLRIHHAWIHSCSHRCSSTWVYNMHSRTELTWERLNIACSLS